MTHHDVGFCGSAATQAPLRVLVVEGDEDCRELMAEIFRSLGARAVALAESAENALERLRAETYDLIVTGVGLHQVSGLEMIDQANAEGRLVGTMLVVCSANPSQRRPALARGAAFVLKPLSVEKIVGVVQRARGEGREGTG